MFITTFTVTVYINADIVFDSEIYRPMKISNNVQVDINSSINV